MPTSTSTRARACITRPRGFVWWPRSVATNRCAWSRATAAGSPEYYRRWWSVAALTGSRLVSLPFSDECYPIGDARENLEALADAANQSTGDHGLAFFEMRGTPRAASGDVAEPHAADELVDAYGISEHFDTFHLHLTPDSEAVFRSLHKKAVRPTIKRSFKLGVTVRTSRAERDIRHFYRLYCLTRRKHGIPPQPLSLFTMMMSTLTKHPEAILYIAEHDGKPVGASIVLRYNGVVTLKYEVTDERFMELRPVYAMLWQSIEDAARDGFHTYDFGRTEKDNDGLAGFKKRWGTERVNLPYYYAPPSEGLSTVDHDSLKYKLFTAVFGRLPIRLSAAIGSRIFRHFG